MRILVISTCFHPKNSIASYRIEAFARYFREAGHSVTVLTEGERDEVAAWHGCEIRYVASPVSGRPGAQEPGSGASSTR